MRSTSDTLMPAIPERNDDREHSQDGQSASGRLNCVEAVGPRGQGIEKRQRNRDRPNRPRPHRSLANFHAGSLPTETKSQEVQNAVVLVRGTRHTSPQTTGGCRGLSGKSIGRVDSSPLHRSESAVGKHNPRAWPRSWRRGHARDFIPAVRSFARKNNMPRPVISDVALTTAPSASVSSLRRLGEGSREIESPHITPFGTITGMSDEPTKRRGPLTLLRESRRARWCVFALVLLAAYVNA